MSNFQGPDGLASMPLGLVMMKDLDTSAQLCRLRAVHLFLKAREKGQHFVEEVGAEEAIMADLLRRSRQFDLALTLCKKGLERQPEKNVLEILEYQQTLIERLDVACHTVLDSLQLSSQLLKY